MDIRFSGSSSRRQLISKASAALGSVIASVAVTRWTHPDEIDGRSIRPLLADAIGSLGEAIDLHIAGRVGASIEPTGSPDDSARLQAFVDSLGEKKDRGGLRPGTYYAEGLVIPNLVALEGWAGRSARFEAGDSSSSGAGGVIIRRPKGSSSSKPIVTLQGAGAGLRNVTVAGSSDGPENGPGIVAQGFETTLEAVRVIGVRNTGLDVQRANNTKWSNVYVDDCGTEEIAAVRVWSKKGVGSANETNTMDVDGLTIERSANVALDLAYNPSNPSDPEYWAEFVRINRLHIESTAEDVGASGKSGNRDPLVRIGNVRSVQLISPFIYGGPGPLLMHDQRFVRSYGNGGIKIVAGTFLGSDTATGVSPTPTLFHLVHGEDFSIDASRWFRAVAQAIVVDPAYGHVSLGATNYPSLTLNDRRTTPSVSLHRGGASAVSPAAFVTRGVEPTVVVTGGSLCNLSAINCSDVAGSVVFDSVSEPEAGHLFALRFGTAYSRTPTVLVSANTSAAAALGLYVRADPDGFSVECLNPPMKNSAEDHYGVSYMVVE